MKIEPGRVIVFIIVLWIIGAAIHNARKYGGQPSPAVTASVQTTQPALVLPKAPIVSISRIWPDGATPTKVVHIPDPQEPAEGLMNITLHQRDDLELDLAPLWVFNTKNPDSLAGTEMVINSGSGFESEQEYLQHRAEVSGTNSLLMKARTVRIRLAQGQPDSTYSLVIHKAAIEAPLPPVPPQTCGDLTIIQSGIHGLNNGRVVVDLVFRNTGSVNTIAVAMYADPPRGVQHNSRSSLICSDGTPYVVDVNDTMGVNALRANPRQLVPIDPGQELKASLEFQPRGVRSSYFTSFTFQTEVVVNYDYRDGEYYNYRETQNILPPYCKVVNAMFDIPVRLHGHN